MTFTMNSTKYAPPCEKYLVRRNQWYFVGTPCYGMHSPWWVAAICGEDNHREAEPVAMRETDEWVPSRRLSMDSMGKPENLTCPECGGQMVSRLNRATNQRFWGCKQYPTCNGTRDTDGQSRAEREQERRAED